MIGVCSTPHCGRPVKCRQLCKACYENAPRGAAFETLRTRRAAVNDRWMADARCRGMDNDLFFPKVGDGLAVAAMREFCGGCPVRAQCLEYAVVHSIEHGVWGGLSVRERRRVRREGVAS